MKKLIIAVTAFFLLTSIGSFAADEPNVDFGPYMRDMQRNIKLNWEPQKLGHSTQTTVFYSIKKDGTLKNVSIYKSSGDKKTDAAAIKAVKKTKFRPLPTGFDKDSIDVQFTFDYNVFGKNGKI